VSAAQVTTSKSKLHLVPGQWIEELGHMTGERAAERVRVDAVVKIHGTDEEQIFQTRDLSEQGLFLYTKVASAYSFRVGSTLELDLFDLTDSQLTCKVVVVRIVQPNTAEAATFPTGFGVKIIEIADAARAQIRAMVARVKANSAS
jgi:hypothetical protein